MKMIRTLIKVDENRTATLLLGDNNKLTFYMGLLETPIWTERYLVRERRCVKLLKRKEEVLAYSTAKGKPDQGMIVIIKPSKNLIIKCN
jgi:hypothetical protein